MNTFFSQDSTALKICGITIPDDAHKLASLGVEALGLNFWEKSKRFCAPEIAKSFSPDLEGEILRVGVFVNASEEFVLRCFKENLIDVAQFHGDEDSSYLKKFSSHHLPFIKAIGVDKNGSLPPLDSFFTKRLLLDAHAPGVYGGTGETIDWNIAGNLVTDQPDYTIMLAGGITPENAREATKTVKPSAIDIASGVESSPGVKDFNKIQRLQEAVNI